MKNLQKNLYFLLDLLSSMATPIVSIQDIWNIFFSQVILILKKIDYLLEPHKLLSIKKV